jgi:hypothetical protein
LTYSISRDFDRGPPKVQRFVHCTVRDGTKPAYSPGVGEPVVVTGTFHVGVERDPETGMILSVYRLDVDDIKQVTGSAD